MVGFIWVLIRFTNMAARGSIMRTKMMKVMLKRKMRRRRMIKMTKVVKRMVRRRKRRMFVTFVGALNGEEGGSLLILFFFFFYFTSSYPISFFFLLSFILFFLLIFLLLFHLLFFSLLLLFFHPSPLCMSILWHREGKKFLLGTSKFFTKVMVAMVCGRHDNHTLLFRPTRGFVLLGWVVVLRDGVCA